MWIKERGFKNCRWENNFIKTRVVISIYRLRHHVPFSPICFLTQLLDPLLPEKLTNPPGIFKESLLIDFDRFKFFPSVRKADLWLKSR